MFHTEVVVEIETHTYYKFDVILTVHRR